MTVDVSSIPVVILCGGQGTRIREASESLPKPLIDIGGKPILWHIMKTYHAQGFRRFILCLGYKAWEIKSYFLRYGEQASDLTIELATGSVSNHGAVAEDWEINLVDTGVMSGTGARIPKIAHLLDEEFFMLTYGDGVGDVDVLQGLELVQRDGVVGAVTGVHPTSRFGELGLNDQGIVINFAEKPASSGWVSGGYFAFRRSFVDYFDVNDPDLLLEREPLQTLTHEGKLAMAPHEGFWMGMDTYREYAALNEMWANGTAPWKVWND